MGVANLLLTVVGAMDWIESSLTVGQVSIPFAWLTTLGWALLFGLGVAWAVERTLGWCSKDVEAFVALKPIAREARERLTAVANGATNATASDAVGDLVVRLFALGIYLAYNQPLHNLRAELALLDLLMERRDLKGARNRFPRP